jgi:hypothetical protein
MAALGANAPLLPDVTCLCNETCRIHSNSGALVRGNSI